MSFFNCVNIKIKNSKSDGYGAHKKNKFPFWTEKEDKIILDFGKSNKRNKWVEASKLICNKTPRHCYFRYKTINPNCKKGSWTKQEDELLLRYIKLFGNNWSAISKLMKTRSNKQIHNRFKILINSKKINSEKNTDNLQKIKEGDDYLKNKSNNRNNNTNITNICFSQLQNDKHEILNYNNELTEMVTESSEESFNLLDSNSNNNNIDLLIINNCDILNGNYFECK